MMMTTCLILWMSPMDGGPVEGLVDPGGLAVGCVAVVELEQVAATSADAASKTGNVPLRKVIPGLSPGRPPWM